MTRTKFAPSAAASSHSREDRGGRFDFAAVRASASSPELARNPRTEGARGGSREEPSSPASGTSADLPTAVVQFPSAARGRHDPATILAIYFVYLVLARRELDRGLEDDTVKVLTAITFIGVAVLAWIRWTDAFWMWR